MSQQVLMFATSENLIGCDSADFDGTSDYMTRGAGLTGAANAKTGIFSAWIRLDGGDGAQIEMLHGTVSLGGGDTRFHCFRGSGNKISIFGFNAAGISILNVATVASYTAGATWYHVLSSWDLASAATHLFINDVSDESTVTATDDTIDYTLGDWAIGAMPSTIQKFNGCLAEFYFAPGQYLDFSAIANRRKFISAGGNPVVLGADGSFPTGTAPLVYQHLADGEAVANFATNRATGGDFTITGTLTTGSTSPSD